MKSILLEGLLVAAVGLAFALLANALSPRGLHLTRNYFPSDRLVVARAIDSTTPARGGTKTNVPSPEQFLLEQLHQTGLNLVDSNGVSKLFRDPRRESGLIIFIDARKDEHYTAAHIPGAYQLDHFYPERYLANVLPACQTAEQIVVYCSGGTCDDSLQTAILLRDAGIPKEKLFVYAGGITEWSASGMPTESGDGGSGSISKQK